MELNPNMTEEEILDHTIAFVQHELRESERGHDWWHVLRVYQNAMKIVESEPGDPFIIRQAALLHDIADAKFFGGDESIGPSKARDFLTKLGVRPSVTDQVVTIIENISYKSNLDRRAIRSPELDIVQDADRLDALGAIGIARAFHYGGYKNREIYNPDLPPETELTGEKYKKSRGPTINHFYEKLLRLKDLMNTPTGKQMAVERHRFMEEFLHRFYKEWEGG
jgi:uncharacterized protein